MGKIVIIAALDATFQRKGFSNIMEVIPLAEDIVKLKAVCMSCFGEGSYTKRISQVSLLSICSSWRHLSHCHSSQDQEVEVIGGAEMYMAVCRSCYHSPNAVPASPREPLKHLSTNTIDKDDVSPSKRALFAPEAPKNDKKDMTTTV